MFPLLFSLLFLLILILPKYVFAQETVVLNELLPQPSSGSDWIELYNPTSFEIDLSGYKILDTATTPVKTIGSGAKIKAHEFLFFEVGARLNNGGDTVKLVDSMGNTLDEFSYSQSTPDQSYARIPDGIGSWITSSLTKGYSNGQASQPNTPQTSPQSQTSTYQIKIWEVIANPSSGNEWVELYNAGDSTASLTDWKIDDIPNDGGSPKKFSATIPPNGYFVLNFSSGFFNNDKDDVRLLSSDGGEVDKFSYQETTKGNSWAFDSGSWSQTQTPTPGAKNLISTPKEDDGKKASKREASQAKDGPSVAKSAGEGARAGGISKSGQAEEGTSESPDSTPSLSLESSPTPAESSPAAITQGFGQRRLVFILIILGGLLIMLAGVRLWYKKRLKED